jgi:hypothetical protein
MIYRLMMSIFCFAAMLLAAITMHCSRPVSLAGGASEETNARVAGSIVNESGTHAAWIVVRLIPSSFNPAAGNGLPVSLVDTADEAGRYVFDQVGPGIYNLEAEDPSTYLKAFASGIVVNNNSDTVSRGADTLHITGAIQVILSPNTGDSAGFVYLQGTSLFHRVQNNTAVISAVPSGPGFALWYVDTRDSSGNHVVRQNVVVRSSDTTRIMDNNGFAYEKKIYLNTTSSGAGVSGNVLNFPVLVRLSGGNFDFAKAKAGGGDLRFAKPDQTPLSFEIERWDSAAGAAEIWVKVDTIYGNNNTQFLQMYWGTSTSSVTSLSNSAAVFDTGTGFQGVWHLDEAGNTVAYDATINHYNGTPYGMNAAGSAVAGAIGVAQRFDGISSFLQMTGTAGSRLNFPQQGTYTISAWVNTDTLDSTYQSIVSKGELQYGLQLIYYSKWEFFDFIDKQNYEGVRSDAQAHAWTHLLAVRSGANEYLYVNGSLADSVPTLTARDTTRNETFDVAIGRRSDPDPDERFFKGSIDEVRIQSVACGPDWARLCYMNQKETDALVVFK